LLISQHIFLCALLHTDKRYNTAHLQPHLLVPEGKKQRVSYPDYLHGFWGALARAEEKGDCIVLPEPHVWSPDHGRKIFVRACYQALADAILRDAGLLAPLESSALRTGTHYWTILGNPGSGVMHTWLFVYLATLLAGIGKTVFMFYLMWRLRQIPTVATVVQQFVGQIGCLVDIANEEIMSRADLLLGLNWGRWFLFDSTAPPIGLGPAVLVTSPKCDICGCCLVFFFLVTLPP